MITYTLPALFGAGLLTFASPCVLPLVPVYLATLSGASVSGLSQQPRARVLLAALGFVLGLGAVFVALGLAATAAGQLFMAHRERLMQFMGFAVILLGLKALGVISIPALERESRPLLTRIGGRGFWGALLLGAGFALGWSPCIGPVLGSVLTFTASSATSPVRGALYLGAYAAGLSAPLLGIALVATPALRWLSALKSKLQLFERATGALLVAVGLLLATDSLSAVTPKLAAPHEAPVAADQGAGVCEGTGPCALPEGAADEGAALVELPRGPAMIEFVSRSCPVCQRMVPVVASAEHACSGQGARSAKVWVDTPEGRRTASLHGVRGVPTFVFVDGQQAEVARLVGEQPLSALRQALEVTVGANCAGFRPLAPSGETPPAPTAGESKAEGTPI